MEVKLTRRALVDKLWADCTVCVALSTVFFASAKHIRLSFTWLIVLFTRTSDCSPDDRRFPNWLSTYVVIFFISLIFWSLFV